MSAGGTGELVDPDLRAALAVLPDFGSLTNETLPAVRQLLAATAQLDPPIGLTVEAVSLPGAPGTPEVTGLLHRPATSGPHAAILNLHGGGLIAGTAEREDAAMRPLALALDAAIYVAPGRATILAGFPPTFIATGAIDLFVDEDPRFAQSLIGAGVPTELHDYPGACHGFTLIAAAGVTQQFERDSSAALHRALDTGPTRS